MKKCTVFEVTIKGEGLNYIIPVVANCAVEASEYIIRDRLFKDDGTYVVSSSEKTTCLYNATDKNITDNIEIESINPSNVKILTSSESEHYVYYLRFGRMIPIASKFDKFHEANLLKQVLQNEKKLLLEYIKKDVTE